MPFAGSTARRPGLAAPSGRHALLCALVAGLLVAAGAATARELHVGPGQPYATIQAAVAAAAGSDVVLVHDGVYRENVVVTRRVTLRSLDFAQHGENDGAVLDAGANGAAGFLVMADQVVVEGFTVLNARGIDPNEWAAGIAVLGASGCRVAWNRCGHDWETHDDLGVSLVRADDAVVTENEISHGMHGIWIEDSARAEIRGNHAYAHIVDPSSSGLYLRGQSVKTASTAEAALLVDNWLQGNNAGIHVGSSATHAVIEGNVIENGYVGVLVDDGGSYPLIAGNVFRGHTGRGIHINGAHHATIVGNDIRDNEEGIWLGFVPPFDAGSDFAVVVGNEIADNRTTGVRISDASRGDRFWLNRFAANGRHVRAAEAQWTTDTAVSYFVAGANHGHVLGNWYDTYRGLDLDGDGIGDTDLPFHDGDPATGPRESAPLTVPPANVDVQAWLLDEGTPAVMRRGDLRRAIREVTIPAGGSVTWFSATAASGATSFPTGPWLGWLRWAVVPRAGAVRVQVGRSGDGRAFLPTGAQAVLDQAQWNTSFITTPSSVIVPGGWHLALRIVNDGPTACVLVTGGGMSALTSPGTGDPSWPAVVPVEQPAAPAVARLEPNRPNPFNPRTEIGFWLPAAGPVVLRIYDPAGRLVRTLLDDTLPQGRSAVIWDGTDDAGRTVASGAYLCRLAAGGGGPPQTRRLLLVR